MRHHRPRGSTRIMCDGVSIGKHIGQVEDCGRATFDGRDVQHAEIARIVYACEYQYASSNRPPKMPHISMLRVSRIINHTKIPMIR